jgi:N-glycosylase/DNA lyase
VHASDEPAADLAAALKRIPPHAWGAVLRQEPEWKEMEPVARVCPPGLFLCAMLLCGLNDYHLRGRADEVYWPAIALALRSPPPPNSPRELESRLGEFYRRQRKAGEKLETLRVFFASALARELCQAQPAEVAVRLGSLRQRLEEAVGSTAAARMVPLALKCVGIGLLILGVPRLELPPWPLPLDPRVRSWTPRLAADDLREFWRGVLNRVRSSLPEVTLLHLDSLLWQLARVSSAARAGYLASMGVPHHAAARVVEALARARARFS